MELSRAAKLMAGITLIIVPTIEYGGFRAGHAHAGVIIILSLIGQVSFNGEEHDSKRSKA
jgi:hypothetical protein